MATKKKERGIRVKDGSFVKASWLRQHLGEAPSFAVYRHRLRSLWLAEHLLEGQRGLYKGLASFAPLVESIDSFLRAIEECENNFLLAAWDEIDPYQLESLVREFVSDLDSGEVIPTPYFSIESNFEIERFAENAWEGISRLVPWLQDAVFATYEFPLPDLWRLGEFNAATADLITPEPSETKGSATPASPLIFCGEAWAEDAGFSCKVERLVFNGSRISMQLACNDDSGPHVAEGSFELVGGIWQTRNFSVRYKGEKADEPARFHLSAFRVASDGRSARLEAAWDQGGESYLLDADLEVAG